MHPDIHKRHFRKPTGLPVTATPLQAALAAALSVLCAGLAPGGAVAASVFTGPRPVTSHTSDSTPPTVEVLSVSTDPVTGVVTIIGNASDNRALNVARWSNSRGGDGEITMTGTYTQAQWSVDLPPLQPGSNLVVLRFADETGNNRKETLTLTGAGAQGATTPTPTTTPTTTPSTTPITPPGPAPGNAAIVNPILFAAEVPTLVDFASRASTFGNHLASEARRGGDLVIRYPNGTLRNLTQEAGFSNIAVREPSVSWDGRTALFSMVTGASNATWQMYEVQSGLRAGDPVRITKLPGQPADYNNVSPIYGTTGRILFTSDRPRSGLRAHFPQRDEYESVASVTGVSITRPAAFSALRSTALAASSPSAGTICNRTSRPI